MDNILVATFLTGLTTGGLSCFAVQGGLLSGSIARQAEPARQIKAGKKKAVAQQQPVSSKAMALSVVLFLAAKLVVYTLLGFGLGWLGSVFYLSPTLKGAIQIAIGIFLLGNGLRMFNVHPIFRYFTFEPPSSITRYIRKISKGNDRLATPLFLGALTILIPCGITQAAMDQPNLLWCDGSGSWPGQSFPKVFPSDRRRIYLGVGTGNDRRRPEPDRFAAVQLRSLAYPDRYPPIRSR
jgi:sulfite exporter TauE/SafE